MGALINFPVSNAALAPFRGRCLSGGGAHLSKYGGHLSDQTLELTRQGRKLWLVWVEGRSDLLYAPKQHSNQI